VTLLLIGIGLAVTAFIPRALVLDRGFMIDEKLWIERSARFTDAVLDGRFGDALTSGHPGVTTAWVAGLAQRTLPRDASLVARYERARLALAVVDVLLLIVIWLLARGVLGELAALLGVTLLALDPFLLAHNRVVHLDGLQTLFMTASLLALVRGVRAEDDGRWMALAGALAGFGMITRTFAAFLVIVAVVALWRDGRGIMRRLVPFIGAAVLVYFVLWPLMWVRPWKALSEVVTGAGRGLADDSDAGRFFLGAHIPAPGPIFYPVAFALRASTVGFLAGVATAVWAVRRRASEPAARNAAWLLLYALGFLAIVSLTLKTADRYLLPSLAAVDLAVGVALARVLRGRGATFVATAVGAALALHAGPALALHPYEFAHYDWAAGGPYAAVLALPVGRGEGLDVAARVLANLPSAPGLTVATTRLVGFQEFFPGRTIRIEDSTLSIPGGEKADLVLFYISSIQTGRVPRVWARYRDRQPLYVLRINRIAYVRVYRA
jgi:4-amino-4-deoxy-L-arabinose transferase-like glycosyltransferase